MSLRRGSTSPLKCLPMVGAAAILIACTAAQSRIQNDRTVGFVCDHGARFSVVYRGERAQITTPAGRWLLERRPSSFGQKYSSETATFIHDEDRAALNGLPGGPFRRCREAGPRLTSGPRR